MLHDLLNNDILLLLFSRPVMSDSVTAWNAAREASLSFTISQSLPKFMITASVMPISSSDSLFSFCPRSFPASGTFPMSCLFEETLFLKVIYFSSKAVGKEFSSSRDSRSKGEWFLQMQMCLCKRTVKKKCDLTKLKALRPYDFSPSWFLTLFLSFLGLLEQNTVDWVASITHIYFFRVWKLEIQDWGAGRVGVTNVPGHGWSPSHCVLIWPFLSMHAFSFFSPKGINFFIRVLPSGPHGNLITFPKPTSEYHHIES